MGLSWDIGRKKLARAAGVIALAIACAGAIPGLAAAQQTESIAALNARLFNAVRSNDIATVRLALTNGADPMAVDENGQTPAGIAIDRGYFEVAHHILGVRNQRQALEQRAKQEELIAPPASTVAVERGPTGTWRDAASPGHVTEIPSARIASPRAPVVVTPAPVANAPRPAAKKAATTAAPAPKPPEPPKLTNLPQMPAGAPNPFDPQISEPAAPPVLTTTASAAPKRPETAQDDPPKQSGNALTRFFNGITGVFGGGGS